MLSTPRCNTTSPWTLEVIGAVDLCVHKITTTEKGCRVTKGRFSGSSTCSGKEFSSFYDWVSVLHCVRQGDSSIGSRLQERQKFHQLRMQEIRYINCFLRPSIMLPCLWLGLWVLHGGTFLVRGGNWGLGNGLVVAVCKKNLNPKGNPSNINLLRDFSLS